MGDPPSISLMIHTASPDHFLERQYGIQSYFEALTACLSRQTFQSFELVFVDACYERNRDRFHARAAAMPFQIKHVPIHHNHRYWFDRGNYFISAAKNTGVIYADGQLAVSCDDAELFPERFLERYWANFQRGRYMCALHVRLRSLIVRDGLPIWPLEGEAYSNDHRIDKIQGQIMPHPPGALWTFAGTSFSVADAVRVNGFNERMDGCKGLEDCDFGRRLSMLGRTFVADRHGFLLILDHAHYADVLRELPESRKMAYHCAIENFGLLRCADAFGEIVANKGPITYGHIEIIREETIKHRHFDPLAPEHREAFEIWRNTPTFDLAHDRVQARTSSDWRW